MKAIVLTVITNCLLLSGAAFGYDPPEIIGVLTSPQEESNGFATDFCWVGDQNGDGYDDLLVNQDRYPNDTLSRVYLYHGGEVIENEPAFTYTSYERNLVIGRSIGYFGFTRGQNQIPILGFMSTVPDQSVRIDLYECLDVPDANPISMFLNGEFGFTPAIDDGFRNRPIDFNGDGFNDIIVMKASVGFQVYYGGEDLDTLPDWSKYLYTPYWSSGLDINGDNCGDIIIFTRENNVGWYSLYLGGDPADTIPAVRICIDDYNLTEQFTMLPDINDDGYDDWGVYWYVMQPSENDGFYIFLGGEYPDMEPDLNLEGTRGRWVSDGYITGGDFNGDGIGDIVTEAGTPPDGAEQSELMIHFGNRWIAEAEVEHRADIYIDMTQEYGGIYPLNAGQLGAVGDYNGDGIDDFVWGGSSRRAIIFAGNRNWRVDVPKEKSIPTDLKMSLSCSPNPFNTEILIAYSLSRHSNIELNLYDTQGRLINRLDAGMKESGGHSVILTGLPAGLYLLVLNAENQRLIHKIVCLD